MTTREFPVPRGTADLGDPQLTFWHTYQFEPDVDGGVLEISTNDGEDWYGNYSITLKEKQPMQP